jgi:hypothetical protein
MIALGFLRTVPRGASPPATSTYFGLLEHGVLCPKTIWRSTAARGHHRASSTRSTLEDF